MIILKFKTWQFSNNKQFIMSYICVTTFIQSQGGAIYFPININYSNVNKKATEHNWAVQTMYFRGIVE